MNPKKCVPAIFQIVQIIVTVILGSLAIFLSKEVWEKYRLKSTNFSKSDVPITPSDSPTIVIGFWPLKNTNYSTEIPYQLYEQMELGKDFNLTFGVIDYKTVIESVQLTENHKSGKFKHKSQ